LQRYNYAAVKPSTQSAAGKCSHVGQANHSIEEGPAATAYGTVAKTAERFY